MISGFTSPFAGIDFDENGPRIGQIGLIHKTPLGFVARSADELSKVFGLGLDLSRIEAGLATVCRAMNSGDLSLAAIASGRLPFPPLSPAHLAEAERLLKAAVDDPKHPGYPAHTPDDKGGEFRPKDDADGPLDSDRSAKRTRLVLRRGFRTSLRRILTAKRLLRLIEENGLAAVTEEIPGVDVATTVLAAADDLSIYREVAASFNDTEAAIAFVEKGPCDLSTIQLSPQDLKFKSFDAFKKTDLEKFFGLAGDGYEYHHLVEQTSNAGRIPDAMLQSTDNIVKIPRLLHEEISSIYATPRWLDKQFITPRNYLRGKSYDVQREFGISVLREVGIIH